MKIKAVKIDPKARLVSGVEFDGLEELMELVDHMTLTMVPICAGGKKWQNLTVYGDDEGMLKEERYFTLVPFYPQPLAGVLLLTGMPTIEGDETDCFLTPLEVGMDVQWLGMM